MKVDILTLFPDMFSAFTGHSILGRAAESGLLDIQVTDIRDHTKDKHKKNGRHALRRRRRHDPHAPAGL